MFVTKENDSKTVAQKLCTNLLLSQLIHSNLVTVFTFTTQTGGGRYTIPTPK